MKFEIGKYYQHTSNSKLHIVSAAKTTMWGWTLIAETNTAGLVAVGKDDTSAIN